MATLVIAFTVEFAQLFRIVEVLGLAGNRLAETVIGTGFSLLDLLAYTLGVGVAYAADGAMEPPEPASRNRPAPAFPPDCRPAPSISHPLPKPKQPIPRPLSVARHVRKLLLRRLVGHRGR